jgi:hypothetical protein
MGKATDGLSTLALETPGPENIDGRPSPREAPPPLCHCATRPGPAARYCYCCCYCYCYCYCHCDLPIAAPAPAATAAAQLRALSVDCRLSIVDCATAGDGLPGFLRPAPCSPASLSPSLWLLFTASRSSGLLVGVACCTSVRWSLCPTVRLQVARRTARDFPCARQWPPDNGLPNTITSQIRCSRDD